MLTRQDQIRVEIEDLKHTKAMLVEDIINEFNVIDEQISNLRKELRELNNGKRKAGNGGRLRDNSV